MARRPKIRPHEINVPVAAHQLSRSGDQRSRSGERQRAEQSSSRQPRSSHAPLSFPARPPGTPPFCFFFRGLRGSQRPRRSGRQHISSLAAAINVPVAASASEPTDHRRASPGAVTSPRHIPPAHEPPRRSAFSFVACVARRGRAAQVASTSALSQQRSTFP